MFLLEEYRTARKIPAAQNKTDEMCGAEKKLLRESRLRRKTAANKQELHLRRRPAANNRQGVRGNKKQIEGQDGEIRDLLFFSGSALVRVCDTEVVATCRDYCFLISYACSLL